MDHTIPIIFFSVFLVLFAVILAVGFLLKGERFTMKQDTTGKVVEVKRGFSFTYLFFGPFVPLLRGHVAGFFLTLLVELFSCGIARLILLFCYNGMYINWLANNGFQRVDGEKSEDHGADRSQYLQEDKKKEQKGYQQYNGVINPVKGNTTSAQGQNDSTMDLTTGKLEAVSGVYRGAVIELLYGESLVIGRDKNTCGLVIEEKEISRRHCEIAYDTHKRCFYVTDYSTNGVYLDTSQPIQKNQPVELKPDTEIRLGRSENVFLLRI